MTSLNAEEVAARRRGVWLFYAVMALFWLTVWTAMVFKAHDLGHGLGPWDGTVYPCGQQRVDGRLDGRPAVPADDRFDEVTRRCQP